MNAPRISPLFAALLLTASADLPAQQQEAPVGPGDRVRVRAPGAVRGHLVGSVVTMRADTLVLEVEGRGEQLALPLASVTSLEASRGRKSNLAKGAGLGLVIGGAVGAVTGVALCGGERCESDVTEGEVAGILGAMGAGAGLLIGTTIGAIASSERWEAVPLNRLRVSMVPRRNGGLAIRVTLAF